MKVIQMDKIFIAICDDTKEEQERVKKLLLACKKNVVIDFFSSGEDLLLHYEKDKYDLLLMDIYMDGLTGIQTIEEIRKIDEEVVVAFMTTSLEFTLESYRLSAIKYIEKPASQNEVCELLEIVQIHKKSAPSIEVISQKKIRSIYLKQIVFIEQKAKQFHIHLINDEIVISNGKISEVYMQLDPSTFIHCHKSYIVNLAYVDNLNEELTVFEMKTKENVHIRRESMRGVKRSYEDYLFMKVRGR